MAAEENLIMLITHDYSYYGYFLWIGKFPVCIMLAWATISYLGFILASKYNTILGVAAASSMDLILEPAALFFGLWTWNNLNSLNYFNAPPQNAVGWLLFTLIGTIILKKTFPNFLGCRLRKEIVLKAKDGFGRKNKITIGGSKKDCDKTEELLKTIENLDNLYEGVARLKIQQLIDEYNIKPWILFNGNGVWSKKRVLNNLKQIMKHGTLYDGKHPRYIPIGSMLRMPSVGKTILSTYFYEFLHLCCGSIAHYSIRGWVTEYPTLEDLKAFFKKNEFGKRVLDDIPGWKTDARLIVKKIEELLFPEPILAAYIKSKS